MERIFYLMMAISCLVLLGLIVRGFFIGAPINWVVVLFAVYLVILGILTVKLFLRLK